jgi:hypothetical protein
MDTNVQGGINMKITREIDIDINDVRSCLVGAFESGSGYWARTTTTDHAGLKRIDWRGPELEQENKARLEASGESYLHWRQRAGDDLEWLKSNGYYIYSSQIPFMGGELTVYDCESWCDEKEVYEVTLGVLNQKTMERGLQLMAEKSPRHFDDFINESGDSTTSDVMFQYMVMGKVIYG